MVMSAMEVPEELTERMVARHGAPGRAWIARLPGLVAELAQRWSLELEPPFSGVAGASWVAPAGVVKGMPVVLKVGWPHREARTEAAGLRFFAGRGAVRLLRADSRACAVLEERCLPGDDLYNVPLEEGNAIAAELLGRLWRPAVPTGPIESLSDIVAEWLEEFPDGRTEYPPDLVARAGEVARELVASQPGPVVLHGDFNPGNILASQRDGWLSIDCKPLVGDPAYDLAQFLANRLVWSGRPAPVAEMARQIAFFAEALHLEFDRIARWAFVKSLGWKWGPATARAFAVVAGLVDAG